MMAGTVLENLSNRKLICVLSVILAFLVVSFLIGAFIGKLIASFYCSLLSEFLRISGSFVLFYSG